MSFVTGVMLLAIITAIACAIPGVFLVLRRNSMLVDAISHSVFPGIVAGFYFTHSLDSPLLIIGAALAGILVVMGNEWLIRTGLLSGDSSQGLIFPALFSVGVILVTMNFAHVHLDEHAVLTGDLNLVGAHHLEIAGQSIGPYYFYVMAAVALINGTFVWYFYNPLRISTFDPNFATVIGMRAKLLNNAFMFLVALTVTAAFNAAGAVLVIALMVIPAASAYLLSIRLHVMIFLSIAIAVIGSVGGFWVSYHLDAATSAGITMFYGAIFVASLAYSKLRLRYVQSRAALTSTVGATAQSTVAAAKVGSTL